MKKQKMTYLSSGIVSLAGLALMGIQANEAQAATTGQLTTDGATTVWTSPEVGQKPTLLNKQPKRYNQKYKNKFMVNMVSIGLITNGLPVNS